MVRRIHTLYQKTLKKYKGDVGLWVDYFNWSRGVGSGKVLSRSFAQAIQFNPTSTVLWIMAAKFEWEENGNVVGARGKLFGFLYLLHSTPYNAVIT
jgi:U3 small nucleolar RNA-associated protein 6